jgi:plastocyanin
MIWRWLICFSCVPAIAATVSGTVVLQDSKVSAVNKRKDYSGVVIWLNGKAEVSLENSRRVRMLQKDKMFSPHILPVVTGTSVEFPNADPIFHNAFSSYSGQVFDVSLYPPGSTRTVRFGRPGVVRVFCNIHPTMSAVILVLSTPYFAKTGADGRFSIDAPPGEYELHVFHERATDTALSELSRNVNVREEGQVIPPISISEAGYLPAPHKNKYGKDYQPPPDERTIYPGVRQ